jgi:hypothetical protein
MLLHLNEAPRILGLNAIPIDTISERWSAQWQLQS